MANPELEIEVVLDDGSVRKAFVKAERASKESGTKSGKDFSSGFGVGIGGIAVAAAGVAAAFKGISFFKESIAASAVQQQAINDLNTQLAITGQYTKETSQDLQNFASELQATSRFGDEAILGQLAFAQAMGATADQSKSAVSAGADLAESLNIDLNSAVRNVSKTLGGYAGELGEVIPELKALSKEQLQAGAGIDLIAQKFGGAAAGRIKTFAGATAQLSNTFGDFQEAIGNVVTGSPAFISVINTTSDLIKRFTTNIGDLAANDPFGALIIGSLSLAKVINNDVIPVFRVFFGFVQTGFNLVKTGANAVVAGIAIAADETYGRLARSLAKMPGLIGETASFVATELENIRSATTEVFQESSETAFDDLISFEDTEQFTESVNSIINDYQRAIEKSREFRSEVKNGTSSVTSSTSDMASKLSGVLKSGVTNAFVQTFQGVGAALAGASSGVRGFVGIIISALGDMAISLGTTIITGTKAVEAFKKAFLGPVGSGVAALSLGAALVVAGGALKVFGSSFGASTPSPSVSGFGSAAGEGIPGSDQFIASSDNFQEEEEREPTQVVNVTIQGDVLDSDQSAIRIIQLLENASLNQGARVIGV